MNQTEDSTAAGTRQASRIDLIDELQRAKELVDCIFLAAHGLGDRMKMNAIARIAENAADAIEAVQDSLEGEVTA
jgi:hypothetical protein